MISENQLDKLNAIEKRAALSLSGIYSLRMLGLFMILPVFSLYAQDLTGNSPILIGLAIGIYGLTQAIFQIPYGLLSDRIGRKPVIIGGMLLFAIGSVVAAMSDSIYGVIAGRALQGSGAIAAAVMALAADVTREEQRIKVMAAIGMSIGAAFAVAMVLGSVLNELIGVDGIFWFTAILALAGIVVTRFWVPDAPFKLHRETETVPEQITTVLRNPELLRLNIGIFSLHMILTATFIVIPMVLVNEQYANLPVADHWMVYLPVMLLSVILMLPFIIIAERKRQMKKIFVAAIAVAGMSELGFFVFNDSLSGMVACLVIFFAAFNLLEASLPSLVSKMCPTESKGTAMGVYSTSQFMGAFLGGVMGGILLKLYGISGVFVFAALVMLCWFFIALTMKPPRYLSSYVVKLSNMNEATIAPASTGLMAIEGVKEVTIIPEDGVAYLKVELHKLDKISLHNFSLQYS